MVRMRALGGSGEYQRNCFLLEADGYCFLLDCGVSRELSAAERVYPLLTREIASRVDAVFLSHAHEDHVAALPFLYQLGYRGPVYASLETIASAPGFMRKWATYVHQQGGTLPFAVSNIDALSFLPLGFGAHSCCGVPFVVGRSGHMLGSYWFQFHFRSGTVLYTGDTTNDGLLLATDPFPQSDFLILDSAYAGRQLDQKTQFATLAGLCRQTIASGGTALLPVPANGRASDILLALAEQRVPMVVERNILERTRALAGKAGWLRHPIALPPCTCADEINRDALPIRGKVVLSSDGMLTMPAGLAYLARIRHDRSSKVILTGHVASGTVGYKLLHGQIPCDAGCEMVTIKVHPDSSDALSIVDSVHPSHVLLFHAPLERCGSLIESIGSRGITVACGVDKTLVL